MKKVYASKLFLAFLAVLFLPLASQAQFFVKQDATGTNDGSSWENAFTDLHTALDEIPGPSGGGTDVPQLWVAAGTYVTTTDAADSVAAFNITKVVEMYGGFAGTESELSARDVASNKTILSGDVMGDDVSEEYEMNKTDNTFHVVTAITVDGDGPVVIDGFEISGGNSSFDRTDPAFFAGGGVHTQVQTMIRNCTFHSNAASTGGGVFIGGADANGSVVMDCTFDKNFSPSQAAGLVAQEVEDVVVERCDFTANSTNRGAIFPFYAVNMIIRDCNFIGNINSAGGFGAAMFLWNSAGTQLINTSFVDNQTQNAMIYVDGRESVDVNILTMDGCTFEENLALGSGATVLGFTATMEIKNSSFNDNQADFGGGFYVGTDGNVTFENVEMIGNAGGAGAGGVYLGVNGVSTFNNCKINANEAPWGAGIYTGTESNVTITNSEISSNISANGGGGGLIGFEATVNISGTKFDKNAGGWGGAFTTQNDFTTLIVDSCEFTGNAANNDGIGGGAIFMTSGIDATITRCFFESNTAVSFGGAMSITEDSLDLLEVTIEDSYFSLNSSVGQGGAINNSNGNMEIVNSIFYANFADNEDGVDPTGRGGAISNNAVLFANANFDQNESTEANISLMNCAFIENDGDLAGGIAQWEQTNDSLNLKATANVTTQNSIFFHTDNVFGDHYGIEAGAPTVTSNGGNVTYAADEDGNIIEDETLDDYLTNAADQKQTNPEMENIEDELFNLLATSPLIDAGVADNAPDTDYAGNSRDGMPDIGPLEFTGTVSSRDLVDNSALTIAPNPVVAQTTLTLENNWTGDLRLLVVDGLGRTIQAANIQKNGTMTHTLNLGDLPAGMYRVSISTKDEVIVKSLIKQ